MGWMLKWWGLELQLYFSVDEICSGMRPEWDKRDWQCDPKDPKEREENTLNPELFSASSFHYKDDVGSGQKASFKHTKKIYDNIIYCLYV